MADILNTNPIDTEIFEFAFDLGEEMVADIKRRHEAEGEKVTGKTSALLRVERTDKGFQLVGWKYTGTWEEGRKPSEKMPPVQPILEWVQAKNLHFDKPYQAVSFAYALAKKIQREGTQRYRNPVDVLTTPINEMSRKLSERATIYLKEEIRRTLLRTDINK